MTNQQRTKFESTIKYKWCQTGSDVGNASNTSHGTNHAQMVATLSLGCITILSMTKLAVTVSLPY